MISSISVTLGIAVSIVGITVYLASKSSKNPAPNLPGITKAQPLWRLLLFGSTKDPTDSTHNLINGHIWKFRKHLVEQCGRLALFDFGGQTTVNVADPELVRMILNDYRGFVKPYLSTSRMKMIAVGLFALEGDEWKLHRGYLSKAFDRAHLKRTADIAVSLTNDLISLWGSEIVFDVPTMFDSITVDILGKVMYSYDFEARKNFRQVDDPIAAMLEYAHKSIGWPLALWHWTPQGRTFAKYKTRARETVYKALRKKNSTPAKEGGDRDLIDILTHGGELSEVEIIEEIMGVFAAGYHTTSAMLALVLFHLIRNPESMSQARSEIDHMMNTSTIDYNSLSSLTYMDKVIKETARITPVADFLSRRSVKAFDYHGIHFPKDTQLQLDIWNLHMNPEHFKDPERFWPERWESGQKIIEGSYIPFSDGPRRCIGEKLAVLDGKAILAVFIHHYDFEILPDQDLGLYHFVTACFKDGLKVRAKARLREE